ncbi:MAG: MoxR family ATPase [Thermofilaceae archaeon]
MSETASKSLHQDDASAKLQRLMRGIKKYFVGYDEVIEVLIIALLSEGHVLIEGQPGLGKTLLAKLFAASIGGSFSRIQMTPDLLPADIIGSTYYDLQSSEWRLRLGPIYANVVFIDELNRATPRTQSALLEAMQERQVTIEGRTIPLPKPFLVIATRIPQAGEGAFELPLLAIDRFAYSVPLRGPDPDVEREVLRRIDALDSPQIEPAITAEEALVFAEDVRRVRVSEHVREYVVNIVQRVRGYEEVDVGPSTRAPIWILKAARALAYIRNRPYVLPDDVKKVAPYALRHRIALKPEYLMDGVAPEQIVQRALEEVEVPKA